MARLSLIVKTKWCYFHKLHEKLKLAPKPLDVEKRMRLDYVGELQYETLKVIFVDMC